MLKSILFIAALATAAARGDTVYVNGSLGSDDWDGRCESWDGLSCGPKASIQAGLDVAYPGDQVLIADGVYRGPGNRDLDFAGKPLTLRAANGDPAACVIDCDGAGRALYFHTGEDAASVVQDLTLRNANGAGTVYCYDSSPALVNCTITGNMADNGGGVYCECAASPTLWRCIITDNIANCGGGIACRLFSRPTVTACNISRNRAAYGAGVWCSDYSAPLLDNCVITHNRHGDFGAGLDCYNSSPILENCLIANNGTTYGGGGLHFENSSPRVSNCVIAYNRGGDSAGGIYCSKSSNAFLEGCLILGNSSFNCGGGLFCQYATATLINCTFTGNSAEYGGGLDCLVSDSPVLLNCTIMCNTAHLHGGGLRCYESSPILTNCVISDNVAGGSGGGLHCEFEADPLVTNCTFARNTAQAGGGLTCTSYSSPRLISCIIWGNAPGEICVTSGDPVVTYCDIQHGWLGLGNFDADPLFSDPPGPDGDPATWADNDYRLLPGSPCVDAGDPEFVSPPGATDPDSRKRLWDGDGDGAPRVDCGAFEFGSFHYGDLNCDASINTFDIDPFVLALTDPPAYAAQYPACDPSLADLDGDGRTTAFDIDPFVQLLSER